MLEGKVCFTSIYSDLIRPALQTKSTGCCHVHHGQEVVVWTPSPTKQPVTRHGFAQTLPATGRRTSSWREQRDLVRKKADTFYQTPENPMAPMFHYFQRSQDNLCNIWFFCNAWRPTKSRLLCTRQFKNTDPIPKELPAHSTAANSSPCDTLSPPLSLGMLPWLSAGDRVSSPVAPGSHNFPAHQRNCFLRKTHFSKWGGITEKKT